MSATAQVASRLSNPAGRLAGWARQGIESFVAAQNILLELTAQQNALIIGVLRERVRMPDFHPGDAIAGVADQGIANATSAGKILLDLAAGESALVVDGLKQAFRLPPGGDAVAEIVRHRIETLIAMQKRLLDVVTQQTHQAVESYKEGQGMNAGAHVLEAARENVLAFVNSETRFLDLLAKEVSRPEDEREPRRAAPDRAKVLTRVARESSEKFIEAQKKLVDLAIDQFEASTKSAPREEAEPEPRTSFAEVTQKSVQNIVRAQKSLLELAANPIRAQRSGAAAPAPGGRRRVKRRK